MAPTFVKTAFSTLLILSSFTLSNASPATFEKRALTVPTDLKAGWSSLGCYTDAVAARTLTLATYTDTTGMTDEACVNFCAAKGAIYAGTEYSQECYCGNALSNGGAAAAAGDCNMACSGAPTQPCGGPDRLNVFKSSAAALANPVTNPGPTGWGILGCYTDSVAARTLPVGVPVAGGAGAMTVELCVAACNGYTYAGVEYASECYCGNAFANGGGPAPDGYTGCNMPCNGNTGEYCGGSNRLDVYKAGLVVSSSSTTTSNPATTTITKTTTTTGAAPTGWSLTGCYTDAVGARTLSVGMAVPGGPAAMTPELCTAACKAAGYTLSGVEYSAECYCDTQLRNGGGPAPDGNTGCNMACNGNAAEICGGANRLSLYSYGGGTPSSSVTTTTATTTTSATSGATGLPAGWAYKGCWTEPGPGLRSLTNQQPDSATLTVESCVAACKAAGYSVAGMEYSTQCFCGNYIQNGGKLATADTDCSMACSGNANEKCGGPDRLSLYSNGTIIAYAAAAPLTTGLPGSWVYQGCLADMVNYERTFPYAIDDMQTNNTAQNCLGLCSKYGYSAGGMEYGDECYCGDIADVAHAGATIQPATDCNTPCPGDPTQLCGGGNRIQYYSWAGLNTFHYSSGNAAGEYDFLLGGVVIPLIVTPGVNGKVTFVEKFGTGPPNSTGAYELDVSLANDFNAAWRTMHVKTDVFCSAGLTLPDRVGRQINVGGWSGVSTFGIRLYWPDGSPGVAGVNDWQENQFELQLQAGRWYPTAMIMANGSILVVGGEDGSNGKPIPSLEILPKPAGGLTTVYCDWLERTDPNNLYPFLVVLPGGGIFVAYYNEARILNEVTFATTKTLPNIPGAVNNFLAGRTYPLEGTSVIMPQIAPYTDPLVILICGGSTPYQGFALDNCVSIQPEVAGAQWTIERMPSKRVITSMTALPDGTYLIANGAHQGMAGFGLASDPNHNAVLYNPTAPKNQRFTLLANTTIDRLYHSEAVLLDDGRVLISGSDPEGAPYVQEYRVEVFIPPYLMGNPARPTFSITNKDWSYGQQNTFTVTTGSTANLKVSLLGAVASTHGNSMGQRTFFPAVTCTGTTCMVTAPPNAHICPPGWFQMFVLDGPTPSVATWVRIGGDPAGLGNWPNLPDFDVPGVGPIGATASVQSFAIQSDNSTSGNLTRRGF